MRMQTNKLIRSSALSPPILQLKPKKASRSQSLVYEHVESQQPTQQTSLTPEECLAQLDIRVGRIVKAWNHPDSEK